MEFARLNGHSVGEFQFPGGRPFLVDGDQRIVYWNWDNRTPCSEEDILADPLLALRTRVFGRQAGWNAASAWQNASRFEFLEPGAARKTFKLKGDRNRWRWIFLPGERITIDFTKSPERVYGATGALQRDSTLRRIAREVTIDFSDVRTGGEIALPWPALRVGGRWVADPGVEPIRIVNLEGGSQEVVCQAAAAEFPFLRTGENEVELKRGNGRIRVTFEIETPNLKAVDAPTVAMTSELLPIMKIGSSSAERIWWQFSNEKEFERILPNLDRVEDFRPQVAPASRIDRTFFSAGEEVWFRAKIRSGGVWSDWSEPVAFTANKPDQPEIRSVEIEEDGQATLSWSGLKGEIMIFGSNRLDFLPDVYVPEEIVRLENGRALAVRENRNLLVAVPASAGSVTVPLRACYRLIARDGELLSVPSRLVRLPRGSNVPPTLVLQNRHVKSDGELTGADIATEVEIP